MGSRGCRFESGYSDLRMSGTENHSRLITLEIAGSTPVSATVAVADLAMHRIVAPDYAGSNPAGRTLNKYARQLLVKKSGRAQ